MSVVRVTARRSLRDLEARRDDYRLSTMLIQERCSNCGAPLAVSRPSGTAHCEFCEAELPQRATMMQPAAALPPTPAWAYSPYGVQAAHRPTAPSGRQLSSALGAFLACVLLAVLMTWKALHPTGLSVDRLHDAQLSSGERLLDSAPVVGAVTDFDVGANVGWAYTIGRAWWADAELRAIDVERVTRGGTVDLSAWRAEVDYRFVSSRCLAAEKKRAETTTNPRDNSCDLVVKVGREGRVFVALAGSTSTGDPLAAPVCSVHQVLRHLDATKSLPTRPSYRAHLYAHDGKATWLVSAGADSASMDAQTLPASFCRS